MINNNYSLPQYLIDLKLQGQNHFLVSDIEEKFEMSKEVISVTLFRMAQKKQLIMVKKGFGILLDPNGGEPHPSSYIGPMMKHVGCSYYVGLLSAASHWGASHQSVMSYQVFADKVLKKVVFDRGRVEFITRKNLHLEKWIEKVVVSSGHYLVSSPELTAIDLVCFPKKSGGINNIATILQELVEKWDGRKVISLCNEGFIPTLSLQRLGYILDVVLKFEKESHYIKKELDKRYPVSALLLTDNKKNKMSDYPFDKKWMLYINTDVEPD